jgi:4'-phosphopantetheinyl transferase
MKSIDMRGIGALAEQLGDHELHVFLMPYERRQRRQPLLDVLGAYLSLHGDEVGLIDGEFGRPELDQRHGRALNFNWSHSGGFALAVIGKCCAPGIDIERRRSRARALDIAEHYFCKEELAVLASMPESTRGDEFLRLWTAKEAVLKALGRGIAFGLHRLYVATFQDRPVLRWLDGDDASAWQVQSVDVGFDYIAALAWRGSARQIQCWMIVS